MMAEICVKRRATQSLENTTKRMRVEQLPVQQFHDSYRDEDDDHDDEYLDLGDSEDEQSRTVDTPITPFSPGRKFPSEEKTIKCTYEGCTKTFNRPARLASHLRSHTNERPFICTYDGCDKAYMEEKHLKQHIKGSHTHEKNYICDWDGCEKSFLTATRLRRHQDAHQGHERFRCTAYPPCYQSFRKHQTLQRHIRSDHLELTPFPCTHIDPVTKIPCNAGFDSGGSLRKHEVRIHGALRFWCDDCSSEDGISRQVGFATKAELTKHIRTEHLNCLFCDLRCSSQRELQKHIETQHHQTSKTPSAPKALPCTEPGCDKTFTTKYNLGVHIRIFHNGERFTCGQFLLSGSSDPAIASWDSQNACSKDFVSKVNLEDHVRTQHLRLPSVVNAKRIKSLTKRKPKKTKTEENEDVIDLLTGAAYLQDETRNIPCAVLGCDWLFTRNYDLQHHLRIKHGLTDAASFMPQFDIALSEPSAQIYEHADLDWQIQHHTAGSTPLWVGAEESLENFTAGEMWSMEEDEMRRLIDFDVGFQAVVDPALRGL